MRLIVLHNHFRPGGVRRVIELAAPELVRRLRPRVTEVVLVSGEAPQREWRRQFEDVLDPLRVRWRADPALLYLAEQSRANHTLAKRLRLFLEGLLGEAPGPDTIVWAHNQGLCRNLLLTRELERACSQHRATLVFHHHDWWFDNRWERWTELRRHGFRSLSGVAKVLFNGGDNVRHASINQADAAILEHHFGKASAWIPNPAAAAGSPPKSQVAHARAWLRDKLGNNAPVWLMPCRLIRRKNIAEGLLLTRWLRPEAWLVTTGAASSRDEEYYAERLSVRAEKHGWRLRLAVLGGTGAEAPAVSELMGVSESVLLTSVQEGFGLPYLEAPAAGRPLIARSLPNVMPDLVRFGFHFPYVYDDLLVDTSLFDWPAELSRQRRLFSHWRERLPSSFQRLAAHPLLAAKAVALPTTPFSRLTLTAQLEILARPVEESWEACAALNPFLRSWRQLACRQELEAAHWPLKAGKWLSTGSFARRFQNLLDARPGKPSKSDAADRLQLSFVKKTLSRNNYYPLTWSSRT